ncbi:hypothetical protein Mth01_45010 [Sphaerimonospora thailandensis]|uniref:Uncharacterized protein n=1 Tax=Sphaerimonospora thailandensis TaxID=795644 RepID=A0A8J3RC24_9ACTN|nr:hypothetical protein Mth01_45010 [Sphaerimonospora thailandensis]
MTHGDRVDAVHAGPSRLRKITGSLEPWVLPHVVHLTGEYVVEIVTDIHTALGDLGTPVSPRPPRLWKLPRRRSGRATAGWPEPAPHHAGPRTDAVPVYGTHGIRSSTARTFCPRAKRECQNGSC